MPTLSSGAHTRHQQVDTLALSQKQPAQHNTCPLPLLLVSAAAVERSGFVMETMARGQNCHSVSLTEGEKKERGQS